MRAHEVADGVVIDTIEVESLDFKPGLIEATTGGIGWLWDGENLTPPAEPESDPFVPNSVGALQGMLALDAAGYAAAFESWANDPARTFEERAFIQKALRWRRNSPVIASGAAALGIDSAGLDQLFIAADAIQP